MELSVKEKSWLVKGVLVLMALASLYFATKVIAEVKNYKYIGGAPAAASTMSFSGSGEVFAAPDIATVNITVREEAKTAAEAQNKVKTKEKSVLDFLAKEGVANKDIKTESYNSYPKYDYGAPCYGGYCPVRTPKVIGYEVSEYISVKVRDLDKAGSIVGGLGAQGVTEISGPNFTIEDEDKLREEARQMAIDEAKEKASKLAEDLGVRLVRIVSFSEDGMYPRPMYGLAKDAMMESVGAAQAPILPQGENKITSNVTVTYEIR